MRNNQQETPEIRQAESCLAVIPAEEFVKRFRNRERFAGFCKACSLWGSQWACPPFDTDPWGDENGGNVEVYADIAEVDDGVEASLGATIMQTLRGPREDWLLEQERSRGGRAFIGVGRCRHCGDTPCSRSKGLPCRHPELMRPSLEAAGFDVEGICRELFGITLQWGEDGKLPRRLVLVTALLLP